MEIIESWFGIGQFCDLWMTQISLSRGKSNSEGLVKTTIMPDYVMLLFKSNLNKYCIFNIGVKDTKFLI